MNKFFMFTGIFAVFAALLFGVNFAVADAQKFEERHGAYESNAGQFSIACGDEFRSMDVDRDGYLNRMEYETAYKGQGAPATIPSTTGMNASLAFGRKDFNNDWMISTEEFCS